MNIDKITGNNRSIIGQLKENQTLKHTEGVNTPSNTSGEEGKSDNVDSVDISSEVIDLQNTLSNLKSELNKIGDVRNDKIDEVKVKMEGGFYDSSEIVGKVANLLVNAAFRPLGV